ncbi:MAG: hypothetical protein WDN26_19340 [Chitinophagaceae bacterium]
MRQVIFFSVLLFTSLAVAAQPAKTNQSITQKSFLQDIKKADSLFDKKKYEAASLLYFKHTSNPLFLKHQSTALAHVLANCSGTKKRKPGL